MAGSSIMVRNYYLDESGSSGDLARPGPQFDFGEQEIFALACIGVDDSSALVAELSRLKAAYGIQAPELKSASVRNKPGFVAELAAYVKQAGLPLLIEVVDKRFMIAATMVNTLVLPSLDEIDLTAQGRFVRNALAEQLHAHAPASVFTAYVEACDCPSRAAVHTAFESILHWLYDQVRNEAEAALRMFATAGFRELLAPENAGNDDWRRFLPLPDFGKRGQPIWMLPNLSCLANIYARLNLLHCRSLHDVTLFHDEHAHFDDILDDAKKMAESLTSDAVAHLPFADFGFNERAKLVFLKSRGEAGIQTADVLAGFVMRYCKDVIYGGKAPDGQSSNAFQSILRCSNPSMGFGVNFVIPRNALPRLGVREEL
jgi:hypothetical protein